MGRAGLAIELETAAAALEQVACVAATADDNDALLARALYARFATERAIERAAMSAAWHARLQPVDPGWLDLAFTVPLLDTTRARSELGWAPTMTADAVIEEVIDGMRVAAAGDTPVLRPRRVPQALLDAVRRGPVGVRSRP